MQGMDEDNIRGWVLPPKLTCQLRWFAQSLSPAIYNGCVFLNINCNLHDRCLRGSGVAAQEPCTIANIYKKARIQPRIDVYFIRLVENDRMYRQR